MKPLVTKRGLVTRDGFACGYVQRMPGGVTIEKCPYGHGLRVRTDDGHTCLYLGPSLRDARRVATDAARIIRAFTRSGWRTRYVWDGPSVDARVALIDPDGRIHGYYSSGHDARLAWAARGAMAEAAE